MTHDPTNYTTTGTPTETPYAKIIPGASSTVDVIFTHAFVPAGTFNLEHAAKRVNTKILLNMHEDDCYQRGIPGIADSIEGVADWLRARIAETGATTLRMIGLSAGGTAAITFGHLLEADAVLAIGPETHLGIPGYRSYESNPSKVYHPRFRNVWPLLDFLGQRLTVVFPAWDLSDFRHIHAVMCSNARLAFVPDMHNGSRQLKWHGIMAQPGIVDIKPYAINGLYDWVFDHEAVWRGAMAFESISRANRFALDLCDGLIAVDPDHPGLHYRAAMQHAMLGDEDAAAEHWLRAEPWFETTGFGIASRCGEYENLVTPENYGRVRRFADRMAAVDFPKIPFKQPASPMAIW